MEPPTHCPEASYNPEENIVQSLSDEFHEGIEDSVTSDSESDCATENFHTKKCTRGTMTEKEQEDEKKCKYCMLRLSKLRQLERIKSVRTSFRERADTFVLRSGDLDRKHCERGSQTSACLYEKTEMTQKERRSLGMILRFRDGRPLKTETFCKCVLYGRERNCKCGEDEKYFEWVWDPEHCGQATTLQEKGCLAVFHKDYSCGTSAVRGQEPMKNDQYFWEIKMTTPVYGTDMMVGVGTSNIELNKFQNTFCSMLGNDINSWGISYDGRVQHAGRKRGYCSRFGQGAIIGVHLDMWLGTLTFFKNRQALGTAYRGLRGRTLYPMACSTAARSSMKVISSRSFPTSLQFMCCQTLRQCVPAHLSVLDALSMPPGLRAFLANNMTWLLHTPNASPPKQKAGSPDYVCPVCLPLKSVFESIDKDDSSDDMRMDHLHMLQIVEDESDEEESAGDSSTMDDTVVSSSSTGSQVDSYWVPLYRNTFTRGTSESSGKAVVSQRNEFGIKKSRIESDSSRCLLERSSSDSKSNDDDEEGTVEHEVDGDDMKDSDEGSSAGGSRLTLLGKRKRH